MNHKYDCNVEVAGYQVEGLGAAADKELVRISKGNRFVCALLWDPAGFWSAGPQGPQGEDNSERKLGQALAEKLNQAILAQNPAQTEFPPMIPA